MDVAIIINCWQKQAWAFWPKESIFQAAAAGWKF
jgi:hypothetical protein